MLVYSLNKEKKLVKKTWNGNFQKVTGGVEQQEIKGSGQVYKRLLTKGSSDLLPIDSGTNSKLIPLHGVVLSHPQLSRIWQEWLEASQCNTALHMITLKIRYYFDP